MGLTVPFWALAGLYLLVRVMIFGTPLGGYDTTSERLTRPDLAALARDLAVTVHRFHWPVFGEPPSTAAAFGAVLALVGLAALAWARAEDMERGRFLGVWAFSWLWALATMAPFAFVPVVPGNGRYWYLPSVGIAMAAVFTLRALLGGNASGWPRVAAAALAGSWLVLLSGNLATYIEAGHTSRSIQQQLVFLHRDDPSRRIFVTGYPQFLHNSHGAPLAQVFHYGMADAVRPPFTADVVRAYPLPPLTDRELAPLLRDLQGVAAYRWVPAAGRLEAVPRPAPPGDGVDDPETVDARGPSGTVDLRDPKALDVTIPPGGHRRLRLIVVAEGNSIVTPLSPPPDPASPTRTTLPWEFVRAMGHFYDGEMYWWLEVRQGEVTTASRVHAFRVS